MDKAQAILSLIQAILSLSEQELVHVWPIVHSLRVNGKDVVPQPTIITGVPDLPTKAQ